MLSQRREFRNEQDLHREHHAGPFQQPGDLHGAVDVAEQTAHDHQRARKNAPLGPGRVDRIERCSSVLRGRIGEPALLLPAPTPFW